MTENKLCFTEGASINMPPIFIVIMVVFFLCEK